MRRVNIMVRIVGKYCSIAALEADVSSILGMGSVGPAYTGQEVTTASRTSKPEISDDLFDINFWKIPRMGSS